MGALFQNLKSILTYKKPKNHGEVFELLEKENEGKGTPPAKPDIAKISKDFIKEKKSPLTIEELKAASASEEKNKVSKSLEVNIEYIRQRFSLPQNQDVIIRGFNIGKKISACIFFIECMIDNNIINQFIMPQLMDSESFTDFDKDNIVDHIIKNVISIDQIEKTNDLDKITKQVLAGMTALFIENISECILIETRGYEKRNIDIPQTESVIKGSQEAFTEDLRTNLGLLRRIIKNENLVIEVLHVGKANNAGCALAYLKNIANPQLINEVRKRINSIDTDLIEGEGMLEQLIEDNSYMLFPQVVETERPDRSVAFLMEGKVLLIVEGTPFAMAVPITLFHLLHTSEDAFLRWQYGSFLRFIRYIGVLIALLLPGIYIALTLYHQEMIPTQLLLSIIRTEKNVPFPVIVEMIMLEVSFELIREGGIRVPGVIGNTLGIVGALILGQAAVAAGLVSPILIIIVAVTGIGSFTIPNYSLSIGIRIARFIIVIFGAIAGFFGVSLAIVGLALIASNMKSFGVPFLSPIAPKTMVNPDVIFRQPIWKHKIRPDFLNTLDRSRQGPKARGWKKDKGGDRNDKGR